MGEIVIGVARSIVIGWVLKTAVAALKSVYKTARGV